MATSLSISAQGVAIDVQRTKNTGSQAPHARSCIFAAFGHVSAVGWVGSQWVLDRLHGDRLWHTFKDVVKIHGQQGWSSGATVPRKQILPTCRGEGDAVSESCLSQCSSHARDEDSEAGSKQSTKHCLSHG
jgi:hypothetical protein